jgi:hypothetical protein
VIKTDLSVFKDLPEEIMEDKNFILEIVDSDNILE